VEEVPPPHCPPKCILVANAYSVISTGTERSAVRAGTETLVQKALRRPDLVRRVVQKIRTDGVRATLDLIRDRYDEPRPSGYSSAGTVVSVGNQILDISPGQKVACAGAGYANHAEVIAVPRNLAVPIPAGLDLEAASFSTLGAIAIQGLRRSNCQFGETCVILGLGLLGLLAVQIGRAAGYRIIGLDIDDRRIALAEELGADAAFNSSKVDVRARILSLTQGLGADAVVIYAASPTSDPVNLAFDLCRQKGRVVGVGAFGMALDRDRMYRKELDFVMSTSYGPGRYDPHYEEESVDYPVGYVRWTENRNMQAFLHLLETGQVTVEPLISGRYPIEQATEAYGQLQGTARPLAMLITYPDATRSAKASTALPAADRSPAKRYPLAPGQSIGVGIVGAGGFVKGVHLPTLHAQSSKYHISAVATAHGERATTLARKYGADLATTDSGQVMISPDVDLVLIGTRHNLHAHLVLKALASGKAVFSEKPLCLNPEELEEIRDAVNESGLPVWVGFNRRYSPLARALKKTVDALPRPCLISYHVNAGFLPADHWTQDPAVGGGRLVGECCHFFDFFYFLLDRPGTPATPTRVSASMIPPNGDNVVARDNLIVTVQFDEGSIASLTYTALGHSDLPKERVEIHGAGASVVLDNYVSLEGYGIEIPEATKGNRIQLAQPNKGITEQWQQIANAMHGEQDHAIPFEETYRAMALTFQAEAALRGDI